MKIKKPTAKTGRTNEPNTAANRRSRPLLNVRQQCAEGNSLPPLQLLKRKCVAHIGQRLVTGQTFPLVHTFLVLLCCCKDRVIPILISQNFWDSISPSRLTLHSRISKKFIWHIVTVASDDRVVIAVELR